MILALYWLCLTAGRLGAVAILPPGAARPPAVGQRAGGDLRLPDPVLPPTTASAPPPGAFFLGAGFASIYPLVAEAIGRRFPYYHPGFFNGIFSLALVGGLVAPATLGYAGRGVGCRRGDWHPADRNLYGDAADSADLAGIEGDGTMRQSLERRQAVLGSCLLAFR